MTARSHDPAEGTAADDRSAVRAAKRAAVQRWRASRKRIDYSPNASAQKIIEHHLAAGLDQCAVGVIDALVIAGHRMISGNPGSGRR